MILKFKKIIENASTPAKVHGDDAGFDLVATCVHYDRATNCFEYGTGISVDIPSGYVGLLFPRSSVSKYDLSLCNSVGVIDAGYHGEVCFRFRPTCEGEARKYNIGDRIGQLVIVALPKFDLHQVGEFVRSDRGTGGFGSTGT